MTYRDGTDATNERRRAHQREMSDLERAKAHHDALLEQRSTLGHEIARAEEAIADARRHVPLPLLASVSIATPCTARWEDMKGDARSRHCGHCDQQVFDLSAMTSDEAEALLRERTGQPTCARFYRRGDGTVMTSDCRVAVAVVRRRRGWWLLATAVLATGATFYAWATAPVLVPDDGRRSMGAVTRHPARAEPPASSDDPLAPIGP